MDRIYGLDGNRRPLARMAGHRERAVVAAVVVGQRELLVVRLCLLLLVYSVVFPTRSTIRSHASHWRT